jgi:hypothetical protein
VASIPRHLIAILPVDVFFFPIPPARPLSFRDLLGALLEMGFAVSLVAVPEFFGP